jgi:hypothetical protein
VGLREHVEHEDYMLHFIPAVPGLLLFVEEKLGNITLADPTLQWPVLTEPPNCPLDSLEGMTQRALNERGDMKGKLLTQKKPVTEMNDDQCRAI